MAVREINNGKPCKGCRKPKNKPTAASFERAPHGRRANQRKAQRAAKMARLREEQEALAKAAEDSAVELSGSEDVTESVVSVVESDSHDLAHVAEVEPVEGTGSSVPSSEVVEVSTEDESVPGMPAPDLTEGLETEPVEEESPLERPVVSEGD